MIETIMDLREQVKFLNWVYCIELDDQYTKLIVEENYFENEDWEVAKREIDRCQLFGRPVWVVLSEGIKSNPVQKCFDQPIDFICINTFHQRMMIYVKFIDGVVIEDVKWKEMNWELLKKDIVKYSSNINTLVVVVENYSPRIF